MKKILILGAKGNLGGQLIKVFSKKNEVIAWDREEIDITDKELVFKKVGDIKPDIIINAAAYNAVDKCEEDENEFESAKKLNCRAVGYLAEAAISVNSILVHYSSDYVFGGKHTKITKDERTERINEAGGFKEDDNPDPVNKYGETKLMGERELITRSGKGLKWYLIRTSKLFGPKGESEVAKPSFFDIMLKLAKEKEFLDVINEETSCFTYTPDLAKATKKIIESSAGYGIYHIVNEGPCTWHQAAKELFEIAGINIKVNPVSGDKFARPAKRPAYSVLLNTKFERLRDWHIALEEYLAIKK